MKLSETKKVLLAKLAYEPSIVVIIEQLRVWFQIGIKDIEFVYVPRTDTEGFLARVGDDLLVAFAGTESLCDLRQDLLFLPTRYRGGWLHHGFRQIIREIQDPVQISSLNLFPPASGQGPARVYAVGHSLGAPIAMGACEVLAELFTDATQEITTFGCPNGWSRAARDGFNRRHPATTNYINHGDYVTWLLGVTSGRPGKDVVLPGKWGHMMDKYIHNIKRVES